MLAAFPLPGSAAPLTVRVATCTRRNEHSPLSAVKALGYLDQILALREARAGGADEAILLNTAGRLACASAANLFLVADGRVLTPPIADGALPGITRGLVLERLIRKGAPIEERSIEPVCLEQAEEAFVTSSLRMATPIAVLEGRRLPAGAPGPITAWINRALHDLTAA
jgi:branched-chain amino acid aminotransferase